MCERHIYHDIDGNADFFREIGIAYKACKRNNSMVSKEKCKETAMFEIIGWCPGSNVEVSDV